MRSFTTNDLNKQVGEVTDAAAKAPVMITRHRKPRFVMMSYEHYLRIKETIVNAGAKLHRFPEQKCINNADENGLEHGLFSWASGLGRIVGRRVGVVAA